MEIVRLEKGTILGGCAYKGNRRDMVYEFVSYFITCTVYFISYNRYNLLIEEKSEERTFLTLPEIKFQYN